MKSRLWVLRQHLTTCSPSKLFRALPIPALQREVALAKERVFSGSLSPKRPRPFTHHVPKLSEKSGAALGAILGIWRLMILSKGVSNFGMTCRNLIDAKTKSRGNTRSDYRSSSWLGRESREMRLILTSILILSFFEGIGVVPATHTTTWLAIASHALTVHLLILVSFINVRITSSL